MNVDLDTGVGETLRTLGDPHRWRIVELLTAEELCVCHLVEELGVAQPLVSHHLRALRGAGLVETEKISYWTYYRLRPEVFAHLAHRLATMAEPAKRERRPCC